MLSAMLSSMVLARAKSDDKSRAIICQSSHDYRDVERELRYASSERHIHASLPSPDLQLDEVLRSSSCTLTNMDRNTSLKLCHASHAELISLDIQAPRTIRIGSFNQTTHKAIVASGQGWQWLTLKSGRVVHAAVHHYFNGDECSPTGTRKTLHTFTYCKYPSASSVEPSSERKPYISWVGVDDGLRTHSMSNWMRYSHCYDCPSLTRACGLRAHIALPFSSPACQHPNFHILRSEIRRYLQTASIARDLTNPTADRYSADRTLTYGEISLEGSLRLADALGLTTAGDGQADSFGVYDLGSGRGMFCILVGIICPLCREVVGIELMDDRHQVAVATKEAAASNRLLSSEEAGRVKLRLGDALNETAFVNASHV